MPLLERLQLGRNDGTFSRVVVYYDAAYGKAAPLEVGCLSPSRRTVGSG